MKLLIVDDDLPFRERLTRSMEKKGFDVVSSPGFKDSLIKTLLDINKDVIYSDIPSLVKGYNNEIIFADIVIKQKNGKDIGLYLNGDTYEMITDLQFWVQSLPIEVF